MAEQSLEQVGEEIEKAHVICIVFSVEKQETLNKIASYWLPFVRENCPDDHRKPVILVGNKIDLIDYSVIDVSCLPVLNITTTFCVQTQNKHSKKKQKQKKQLKHDLFT